MGSLTFIPAHGESGLEREIYLAHLGAILDCALRSGIFKMVARKRQQLGPSFKPANLRKLDCESIQLLEAELTSNCHQLAFTSILRGGWKTPFGAILQVELWHGPGERDSFGWLSGLTRIRVHDEAGTVCRLNLVWG